MSQVLVTESYLDDIADAIRDKTGSEDTYTPAQMAGAIGDIHTADEVVLVSKSVTANGTYNPASDSADGYSGVAVNVPNTYTASDNGKVVVNQALTDQTSKSINANGTHDTTANNSVVVDVPNSYSASDEGKVVSNGTLVSQSARSSEITVNGVYDTTLNDEVTVNVSGGGGGGGISLINLTFYTGANKDDKNFIAYFDGMFIHVTGRISLTSSFSISLPIFKIPNEYKIPAKQPIFLGKTNSSSIGIIDENGDFHVQVTQNNYLYIDAKIYATKGNITQITPDTSKFIMDSGGIVQYGNLQVAVAYGKFTSYNKWIYDFLDFLGDVIISTRVSSYEIEYPDTTTNNGRAIGVYPNTSSEFYSIVIIKLNS